MEKLTLENIAPYLPYGLNVKSWDSVVRSVVLSPENNIKKISLEVLISKTEHKLILRPIDLTKPIHVDGKEIIPINYLMDMELNLNWSDSEYLDKPEYNKVGDEMNSWTVFKSDKMKGTAFGFNSKGYFYHVANGGTYYSVQKQKQLFKWLYANKFDVDGLIDFGLAIDVNTLETNPYN